MQHFKGVLAIVSSEDMGLHSPARWGVEKIDFFEKRGDLMHHFRVSLRQKG